MRRVVVRTAWNEAEAQIVVGRLRLLEIDASMDGGMLSATAFDAALASRGGIQVLVPEDQAERASAELKRIANHEPDSDESTTFANEELEVEYAIEDDPDSDATEIAREEAAFQEQRARSNRRRRLALGVFIAPVVILLVIGLILGVVALIREYL